MKCDEQNLSDIFSAAGGRDERAELAVPSDRRDVIRREWPLFRVYRELVEPHRRRQNALKGRPTKATLQKERQAVRRWAKWDRQQRPAELPDNVPFRKSSALH